MDEKPPYTVSEETIAETKRCEKGFSCLKKRSEDLCQIESCVNGKVHFIKCRSTNSCSYQIHYGYNCICLCPTRKELYNKHDV
jgi:hypothetical protein